MHHKPAMSDKVFSIRPATTPADLQEISSLFHSYALTLNIDLSFQDFSSEVSSLPGKYSSPRGTLLLARHVSTNDVLGCIALRPLASTSDKACEIKRLYVTPAARGLGVGKALVTQVITEAKEIGYECVRLDTLASMREAQKLYRNLGFVEREKYYDTPIEGTVFLELRLA